MSPKFGISASSVLMGWGLKLAPQFVCGHSGNTCICIYAYIYIYTYIYICLYIYMCMYAYINMYNYLPIWNPTESVILGPMGSINKSFVFETGALASA